MHIRCPHCHNPIEVVDESSLSEIVCSSCGSNFSLIGSDTTKAHHSRPRRIAHFELVRELGIGKFGSVWMARDTELDRTVAIKIPRKEALDAEEAEMFLRDARATAQLKHPNIVRVHEVGRENDTVYIVSDYVEGANLKEWLSGQKLSFRESAELVAKVAEALEHAHQSGVVHRDLKPGNIMVDVDGQPHVIDFGLAKRDAGEITMTVDGHILGTPAYMSPEQARGKGHEADARSDVYSLGVILFELLTRELPFRGEAQMLLLQIQRDEPPRPRRLNARIPRDLETITVKCLEKEPAGRYQTAQLLADDLGRWLDERSILARPVGRPERVWRWTRRNPVVAGLSVGVLTTLILGSVVSAYFAATAIAEGRIADRKAKEAILERERATENAKEANEQKTLAQRRANQLDVALKRTERALSEARGSQQSWRKAIQLWEGMSRNRQIDAKLRRAVLGNLYGTLAVQMALGGSSRDEVTENIAMAQSLAPNDAPVHVACCDAAALVGDWPRAAQAFARACELIGEFDHFRLALLQLAADDQKGYRESCRELLDSKRQYLPAAVLMACVVGDNAVDDWQEVIDLASKEVRHNRLDPARQTGLGAAYYHAGQADRAAKTLAIAIPLHAVAKLAAPDRKDEIDLSLLVAEVYLARAYRELGKRGESKKALDRAWKTVAWMEQAPPNFDSRFEVWSMKFGAYVGKRNLVSLFGEYPALGDANSETDHVNVLAAEQGGAPADVSKPTQTKSRTPAPPDTNADVQSAGVFGLPQHNAIVLCDESNLRVSAWNNAKYLYLQAVLWRDKSRALGSTDDDRQIGDHSNVVFDLDADRFPTKDDDRHYSINPWPIMPGMYYQIILGANSTTALQNDSRGRGAIRYVRTANGEIVRVDSFLIPLDEIQKKPGETLRLAYWGSSPNPKLIVNSVGYDSRSEYYAYHLPYDFFHEITLLKNDVALASKSVPRGRDDIQHAFNYQQSHVERRSQSSLTPVGEGHPFLGKWKHAHPGGDLILLATRNTEGKLDVTYESQHYSYRPVITHTSAPNGRVDLQFKMVMYGDENFVSEHSIRYELEKNAENWKGKLIESWSKPQEVRLQPAP